MATYLEISKIRRDGGTQPRVGTNQTLVEEYALAMSEGDEFPPVAVFFDGSDYWLADGFHRLISFVVLGVSKIKADVRKGTLRDAILFSVGANAAHGQRRTNEDKRAVVKRLLTDNEWSKWSDREIARQCRVDNKFVGNIRKFICGPSTDSETRQVNRNGITYTQNTANIGGSYKTNETGGYTKEGFEPSDPSRAVIDIETGEVLHNPWSKEKQEKQRRKTDLAIDLTDKLNWILGVTESQINHGLHPEDRDEVDGLLSTAAVHLRNLVDHRRLPHVTSEESIKRAN